MRWIFAAFTIAGLTASFVATAQAEDAAPPKTCAMYAYAELPLDTQMDGRITIPITVNGTQRHFMVDTGAAMSAISATTANALSLHQRKLAGGMQLFGGRIMNSLATADTLAVGKLQATKFPMIVIPSDGTPTDSDGLLGADVLSAYDIDIDYAAGQFRLFKPNSCPNPVYWTRTAGYARVPITISEQRHIMVDVLLDGKNVTALADTGAETSSMSVEFAKALFHLADNDPRLKARGAISINGNPPAPIYSYPFATLTFEGVQVTLPDIVLLPKAYMGKDMPELLMGASILRQLHLYVSYKDNLLYVTGAEAR
jgi:predicted aspartyl protease